MDELRELDAKILKAVSPEVEIVEGWSHRVLGFKLDYYEEEIGLFALSDNPDKAAEVIATGWDVISDYLYRKGEELCVVPEFSSRAGHSGWLMREMERRGYYWSGGYYGKDDYEFGIWKGDSLETIYVAGTTEYEAKARAVLAVLDVSSV